MGSTLLATNTKRGEKRKWAYTAQNQVIFVTAKKGQAKSHY